MTKLDQLPCAKGVQERGVSRKVVGATLRQHGCGHEQRRLRLSGYESGGADLNHLLVLLPYRWIDARTDGTKHQLRRPSQQGLEVRVWYALGCEVGFGKRGEGQTERRAEDEHTLRERKHDGVGTAG